MRISVGWTTNRLWEPEHPLARTLTGLRAGDKFTDPSGQEGAVVQLRHKYVARLHFVMKNDEARFPEIMGFRSVSINVEQPGGLDEFIQELKATHDWFEEEQEKYHTGPGQLASLLIGLGLTPSRSPEGSLRKANRAVQRSLNAFV